ncbi:glycoside hydrolase family 47 [Pyrenophora seminiperda CCB06]|uniref:alpha-1,2-Mannosidase n=1 Tax=Pyrenophora seminiperda CCB06 TaxID=1302712 RepID=A0A3M7M735_9PLEO|nr:glycoside hydrolase family 47 [Pyrenophora seminiperda CCB06]
MVPFPYDTAPPLNGKHRPKHRIQKNQKYPSIDWPNVPWQNPVDAIIPLPTGKPQALPPIQFKFGKEDAEAKKIRETRKEEVKKQFFKCWENYKEYAWMHDEIRPISGDFSDPYGGWAATLVDSLDTLYIMGFEDEFSAAVEDIESIDFGYTHLDRINVFETNIRHLGGLLASYELSEDKKLLNKAKEVGEMLIHAFDTPNHMPVTHWWFRAVGEGKPQVADDHALLAEIGSLTMEFTRLSQLTGDPKWFDAVTRVMRLLEEQQDKTLLPGMWPIIVNARDANFTNNNKFTLGGMADSTYEYFGKQYALLGGRDASYRKMYEKSMNTASEHALYRPSTPENSDMLMSGFIRVKDEKVDLEPCMEHLACFTGGMFALGGKMFQNDEHVQIGRKLTDTCVWGYKASPSGIMPDLSHLLKCENKTTCEWDEKAWLKDIRLRTPDSAAEKDPVKNIANFRLPSGFTSVDDRRYILRPEAIESVFIMYRITGEQQWQDAAWEMWTSIMRVTDTDLGNSALTDVSADSPSRADSMESFWMAETLKYFYLIFSEPSLISLDDWVFNTEAHPFKIPKPKA